LRRAYKWQDRFACKKVESVANTTAFVSPVAFDLPGMIMAETQLISVDDSVLKPAVVPWQEAESGPYPVSYVQESIWFMEQLAQGTPAYNLPEAWRLKGKLNTTALQQSLNDLAQRHEILRTKIQVHDGKPEQVILNSGRIDLQIEEIPPTPDPVAELQRRLHVESRRLFQLGCAPLARAILFRISADEHVLLLNVHHLISDAWSQRVLWRELANYYCDYCAHAAGKTNSAPALPIQYADFTLWQRELAQSEAGRRDLAYWQDRLRNLPNPLVLPSDHPRKAVRSCKGATQFYELPGTLVDSLKDLSRREGVTLFMTLLAAYKTLLHRYTRETDIVVGSPMAGRERVEVEGLIGLLVNTHALRSDLSGDPAFAQLLHRVREGVLEAYAHQEVPCELVMQSLHAERGGAGHPLFHIVFGWQGAVQGDLGFQDLETSLIEVDTGTAKFDWTVLVTESQGRLHLRSEFDTDLFEHATMTDLMGRFQVLLESIVASPECRISTLPLLASAERNQILVEWNRTTTEYERDRCIHEIFEAQAQKTPHAFALAFEGQTLSYAELNRRANQLARRLAAGGAGPGEKVGLCLERSFDMIIGLLAILKTGSAYVPLDRAYPRERFEFILTDSNVSVLVTDRKWQSKQTPLRMIKRMVCVDEVEPAETGGSSEDLRSAAGPSSLAYVMYTSGSTGTPKGVLVPHRAVVRLVRNTNYVDLTSEEVFLQLAPVTFDASTFEIWGALLNGARLELFPPHIPSLEELGSKIRRCRISTLWLTSGLFNQMVDHQLENLQGIKQLLAGGDALSPAHVAKASRALKGCQLINGYGPTENTTFTCCYRFPRDWQPDQAVPIGKPIANTRVYILDEHMAPVPVGMPGELYASGDGLALGYLNHQELTAERFTPNPFADDSCPQLYRTGDIVRWLTDGNLEFLSRNDRQVKIRGYRVEPGEVENALISHPSVEEAVVVARSEASGTKQLLAYVVPKTGHEPVEAQLRKFAEGKLPRYMVPSRIVSLEALPLTINGKIDRSMLPDPEATSTAGTPNIQAAPRTSAEQMVCSIWREVLQRDGIGIQEDFFQLGGHSLLAMQVISRISRLAKVDLPVAAIFEARTVARLAAIVERAQQEEPLGKPLVIRRASSSKAAELLQHLEEFSEAELDELLSDFELESFSK
jgi:aspartate racemase